MDTLPPLRRATPADASALAEFAERTFRETYSADNRPENMDAYVTAHFSESIQRAELTGRELETLVAMADGAMAGYAQIRRPGAVPPCVPGERRMEIARFYVDGSWHGRGLARAMMDACLTTWARDADTAWLGVFARNHRAVRFYEKCGFRIVGRAVFRMGTDEQNDYVMARAVTPA